MSASSTQHWSQRVAAAVDADELKDGGIIVYPDGSYGALDGDREEKALLSGAFNPLHLGHRRLLKTAADFVGRLGYFELSVANYDKGRVSVSDLLVRIEFMMPYAPIVITAAALFIDKARLMPNSDFVMGADTLERLWRPEDYGGDASKLDDVARRLRDLNCRLVVACRFDAERGLRSASDIRAPAVARDLIIELPQDLFRADISSEALRKNAGES